VELTESDEEIIPTEGMVQNQPWHTDPKKDAYGTTASYPGSCHHKSASTTDIAVCAVITTKLCIMIYVAPPIVVHFNYVKFAAKYLL